MRHKTLYRTVSLVLAVAMASPPVVPLMGEDGGVTVAELTPQAERAIQRGLEYLSNRQNEDGSWGNQYKVASTGLTLMAFMVKGHFPGRPPYGDKLNKGVDFLLRQCETHRGYMGTSMYEHALATLSMSEVWGMSQDPRLGKQLKEAVGVIVRSQNPAGGWRYAPNPSDADLSVTVMQTVALASAKEAGVVVPDAVLKRAIGYVLSCNDKGSGGFGYTGPSPSFAMTAAGTMSLMMCGQRDNPAVAKGLQWLRSQADGNFEGGGHYYYQHYYAAQAMYQAGDAYYRQWYPKIRDSLLRKQQLTNGAWPEQFGVETQFAILILGIPYRFLPIYQR